MHVEVQWQDADYSAAKSFREHFTDKTKSRVTLCGSYVVRAFTKSLGKLAKQKSFSATQQDKHHKNFPIFILSSVVALRDMQKLDAYKKLYKRS